MSLFRVSIVARNPKDEGLKTPPVEVLVDTGSELTWLPKDFLASIKVNPVRKRNFTTATKQLVTRETGYAILSAEGFETVDEVVFAEPGDMALLGVRTMEGFGVIVDNVGHRFVATTTIVATVSPRPSALEQECTSGAMMGISTLWRGRQERNAGSLPPARACLAPPQLEPMARCMWGPTRGKSTR
ncbi:MAG: hypothetical protein FJ387_01955 [Verrucomicrobia bacterium]|nr:hypothetical protein [Verrucomicrobiota bacterium]